MRFIIYSKTAGTFLNSSYGGEFFSSYPASTFTYAARTWPTAEATQEWAHRWLGADDDPKDIEILAVETDNEEATMEECMAAGAAHWEHHIAKSARNSVSARSDG